MRMQQTIVITGASSGIGRALALRAARAGYAVIAVGRRADRLEQLAELISGEGGTARTIALDVNATEAPREIVAAARTLSGRIDVVVANAGFASKGELVGQSDVELRTALETHVVAPLRLVREALPLLTATRGNVFLIGSGVARVPIGGMGLYPASKAALRSLARTLRRELAERGVAVTYVDPGAVDTEFMPRAGMTGAPPSLLVAPQEVARKIMHAIAKRPAVVNAVPWQAAAVALGDIFAPVTEFLLTQASALTGVQPIAEAPPIERSSQSELAAPARPGTVADALEPLAGRMEKLGLRRTFVEELLHDNATIDEADVALRWAGMPNKNERKLTAEVFAALAGAGLVEPVDESRWRVTRA